MAGVLEKMMEPDPEIEVEIEEAPRPEAEAIEVVEPDPEAKSEPKQKGSAAVPSWRLREETAKRRALEDQIQKMESRFDALQKQIAEPSIPAVPTPRYEEDPGAHLMHRLDSHEQTLKQYQERDVVAARQAEETRGITEWAGRFTQEERAFTEEAAPDYYEAVAHLRESRMKEYQALGWDPASAKTMIDREAIQIGIDADRRGVSAPERFYELAKLRGWAQRQPAPGLQRTAENMKRSTSLGPSGKPTSRKMTLAEIAQLDDEEFDRLTAGKKWRKLWE